MSHDDSKGFRKSWDLEALRKRKAERERAEKEAAEERGRKRPHIDGDPFAPTRAWLRKRDATVDFDAKVGTSEVVGSIQSGGFRCKVCQVTLKDSNRYLAHVNSRQHQKVLGVSMRVKRSTVEEIREAFRKLKEEKERKGQKGGSLDERIRRRKEERRREREKRGDG